MRLIVNNKPIPFAEGDTVLTAMLRDGQFPETGGCLCLGGDCPHCLATVDGISYIRTCQTAARPGMVVEPFPADGLPTMPTDDMWGAEVKIEHIFCDVVVIGGGESGQAAAAQHAGKHVEIVETKDGRDAVGIYNGPRVVVRTGTGMQHLHVGEAIVVATGSAEIHPVAPGNNLKGLYTARAISELAANGIELGRVVAIGIPPVGVKAKMLPGELIRFEGNGTVEAVVMREEDGTEHRHTCDSVSLGMGFQPRNALFRMGRDLPGVSVVGDAANPSDIPPCPTDGMVCHCSGIGVEQLQYTWDHGFREMELIKRSTLAGTGSCQGSACLPHMRSFIEAKGKELQPPFTARPVTKQLTIEEMAAGAHYHAMAQTSLDAVHRKLGAQMERSGHWWRPWTYGNPDEEYWAVREAVSIMDVSTLGKFIVSGPDVLPFLERIYPTTIHTIRTGRSKYVLALNERGYVFDDGLVCKDSDTQYTLTFTSGGSSHAEMWLRDWSSAWGYDVRILDQTMTLGAINVTGPLTHLLLERLGLEKRLRFMRHGRATIAGVDCRLFRLSFTGELSYELHHSAEKSPILWQALMEAGRDLGIKPHGLETLLKLRLEKGHIIVGQDTGFDGTPRRIHHDWAVKLSKPDFLGRNNVIRTNRIPLDYQLVGLEMDSHAPMEGAILYHNGEYTGHVTSSGWSHMLNKGVMLANMYLVDGELLDEVTIEGQTARRVALPFYDKEHSRARA